MSVHLSNHPFAKGLIRIGERAIAHEDDAALDAYFAPGYVFHGPTGDLNYEELKGYFASLRDAFAGLKIRRVNVVGEGAFLASRTIFSGRFVRTFTHSPAGPLPPNGEHVEWEVINLFRYNEEGGLAEEWVQTDYRSLIEKLQLRPGVGDPGAKGSALHLSGAGAAA